MRNKCYIIYIVLKMVYNVTSYNEKDFLMKERKSLYEVGCLELPTFRFCMIA